MNLTLVFSGKYRWPEHYFSVSSLGNPQELLTTNQFLASTKFFIVLFSCFAVHTLWAVAIFSTYFRKLKEIGVIQPIFPGHVISCDYGLTRLKNHAFKLKFFVSIFRKLNQINNIKSRKLATFENWEIFFNYYFSCGRDYKSTLSGGS